VLAGLSEWLDAYGDAWQARDARAASELFTEDAVYQWGPFGTKLRGRVMIREAWAEAVEDQSNVSFGYEVMSATQQGGVVRWWCEMDAPSTRTHTKLEGIFRLAFDEDGLCTSLEEWFNAKSDPLDAAT
jgi:ketosteroid isomerase-like protein